MDHSRRLPNVTCSHQTQLQKSWLLRLDPWVEGGLLSYRNFWVGGRIAHFYMLWSYPLIKTNHHHHLFPGQHFAHFGDSKSTPPDYGRNQLFPFGNPVMEHKGFPAPGFLHCRQLETGFNNSTKTTVHFLLLSQMSFHPLANTMS